MPSVSVPAFAKINLALKVLQKRADNYHEIRTIFQTISVHDTLQIDYRPARRTKVVLASTVDIPDNIVVKAANHVLQEMKAHAEVSISLTKRIPMGGGLGGGSSDAAAVLRTLPVLAGQRIGMERMVELAAALGSDVPFVMLGGTALGLGRGEELYPYPEPRRTFGLLVTPEIHVSTPEAYRALVRGISPPPVGSPCVLYENDFEAAVFHMHPLLAKLKKRLLGAGARVALMTGSGAALFGLFPSKSAARMAQSQFPDIRATVFDTLNRSRYLSLTNPT